MKSKKLYAAILLIVLGLMLSACQVIPSGRLAAPRSQAAPQGMPCAPQKGLPQGAQPVPPVIEPSFDGKQPAPCVPPPAAGESKTEENSSQGTPQRNQPAPQGVQPIPPVIEPNFGDDQPAPAAPQDTQPALPRLAPQGQQSAPGGNQPTPPVIEPNFGDNQPAPAAPQDTQPALPRLAPQGQQSAPGGDQPTPPVFEPNFGDNQPAPAAPQQTAPRGQQPAPDTLESMPGVTVSGNAITASFTEAQLDEILTKFLAANPQLPLQNPQVHLQNNQVEIDGYLSQGFFSGDVKIVMTLSIDADGVIRPKVVSGSLGGFNLPASVLDSIQTQIDDGITQYLNSGNNLYKADTITIENGKITVTGTRK